MIIICSFCWFQAIYISKITDGGAAAVDGNLQVGDRLVSVRNTIYKTIIWEFIFTYSLLMHEMLDYR